MTIIAPVLQSFFTQRLTSRIHGFGGQSAWIPPGGSWDAVLTCGDVDRGGLGSLVGLHLAGEADDVRVFAEREPVCWRTAVPAGWKKAQVTVSGGNGRCPGCSGHGGCGRWGHRPRSPGTGFVTRTGNVRMRAFRHVFRCRIA